MSRPKEKEYYPISMRLDINVLDRLCEFCKESGQSKTTAVERAINLYIDEYETKKQILEQLK